MNEKLFRPLNEQITVVHIKNETIDNNVFKETAQNIIFNKNIDNLITDIKIAQEMPLTEAASLLTGRRLRKKLYKLQREYDNESDPLKKEKIFQKIEKLQNKMEKKGFDPTIKHAEDGNGHIKDKKLEKFTDDYEGATDPNVKEKAMKKYQKRSDKLAKKGKPSTISSMEQAKNEYK